MNIKPITYTTIQTEVQFVYYVIVRMDPRKSEVQNVSCKVYNFFMNFSNILKHQKRKKNKQQHIIIPTQTPCSGTLNECRSNFKVRDYYYLIYILYIPLIINDFKTINSNIDNNIVHKHGVEIYLGTFGL